MCGMCMAVKIVLFLFMLFSSLSARIITSDNLLAFEEEAAHLDKDCLVVLDVDDTLIYPKEAVLRSQASVRFHQLVQEIMASRPADIPKEHSPQYLTSKA